jgi:predicted O-linked N-acetylglucosamine transferase (SPINDLY family)
MRRHDLALRDFKQAASLNPEIDYLLGSLILSQLYCCDWQELHQNRSRIIAELRAGKRVATPFAFLALSDSPQDALTCTKIYLADKCSAADRVLWRGQNYQHEKIRLAYVSADYRAHPVAHLTANVFELHDRSRFETFAISLGPDDKSEIRDRIQSSFDHFIEARLMSDRDIAELLYQREIDIAVDLLGYTEYHRIGIFAQRPAPIQVEYLGYPGTTGAAFIDYLLADRWVIPHDRQRFYSERIIYLPDSYQANDRRRPISERLPSRAEVGLPTTGFVFCCFNSLYKITPDMFDVWMRLLQAKDGSVLWLIQEDSTALINLRHQAEIRGVSPERLIFAPKIPLADHLARHRLADLFIDTLPYCGHTTASDALWAGLPVLNVSGLNVCGTCGRKSAQCRRSTRANHYVHCGLRSIGAQTRP